MFGDPYEVVENAQNTIADVADVQVGLVIKPTRFYSNNNEGTPAFRSLNVGPMEIRDTEWVYFTDEGMAENKRTTAHTGDVLIVRSGYPGTSCVVTEEYSGRVVIDMLIARTNEVMLPDFLCVFTNLPHGKLQIEQMQHGVAQKHFNVAMYNSMKIIVPPIEDQERFLDPQ
jgi:type I restriction enzyme S subunit